jgi:hypothetical protein
LDRARATRHENKWEGISVKISASEGGRIDAKRLSPMGKMERETM